MTSAHLNTQLLNISEISIPSQFQYAYVPCPKVTAGQIGNKYHLANVVIKFVIKMCINTYTIINEVIFYMEPTKYEMDKVSLQWSMT